MRSGQVRNLESARVSMPGQLKDMSTGICSTQCVPLDHLNSETTASGKFDSALQTRMEKRSDSIAEEPEEDINGRYI